jgi:hypothetical protein
MAKKRKNWVAEMFARRYTRRQLEFLVDTFMQAQFPDGTAKHKNEYVEGFGDCLNHFLLDCPNREMQYEYGTPEAKAFMDGGNDAGHSIAPIVNTVFDLDHEMAGGREKVAHSMERGV